MEDESSSRISWWWLPSSTSFGSSWKKLGVRPSGRLGYQRRRISFYECLLRLSSKPQCVGASSGLGMVAAAGVAGGGGGGWRWWVWSPSSSTRSRGFCVFSSFSRDLSACWMELFSVSSYDVPVHVLVFVLLNL